MKFPDLARYALWLGVAETALENRHEYHMTTTWLPHLLTNTLSLLLPDVFRVFLPARTTVKTQPADDIDALAQTLTTVVRDNDQYVSYVTPLAVGYILSHPRFNIYKGKLAEKRFAGLGLDALPHGSTAFGLTALVMETAEQAYTTFPRQSVLHPLLKWSNDHPALASGIVLAAATLFWETGEYRIHLYELEQRGGNPDQINMQWSLDDTLRDCAANTIGWLLAVLVRRLLS